MGIRIFLLCFVALSTNLRADSLAESSKAPLDFESNIPEMIAESSWSEDGNVIYEREFVVRDEGGLIHLVRRYKKVGENKLQLIWRSDEAKIMDKRFCAYSQRLPPKEDDVMVIFVNNGYSLTCHGKKTTSMGNEGGQKITPQEVRVGDQYYRFANGDTEVLAGSRALAHATAYYGVRGIGAVTLEFYSDAASCGVMNESNIHSPNALIENDIIASLTCRVTKVPGYYAFHIEGCALGPPLCDAQDYVTTVYD